MNEDERTTYQVVAARWTQFNSLVWQTPVLSLTAQAFLFTVSLDAATQPTPRRIAAALSVVTAALSMLLMAKQRSRETQDAEWLSAFEKAKGLDVVHGREHHREWERTNAPVWARRSIYRVWQSGLAVFGVAGFVVLVLSVVRPGSLS